MPAKVATLGVEVDRMQPLRARASADGIKQRAVLDGLEIDPAHRARRSLGRSSLDTQKALTGSFRLDRNRGEDACVVGSRVDPDAARTEDWASIARRVTVDDDEWQPTRLLQKSSAIVQKLVGILLVQRHARLNAGMDEQIVPRDVDHGKFPRKRR